MNIDLPRHLRRLLHVHIVVEEVLQGGDLAQRLQLVPIALLALLGAGGGGPLGLGLGADASDSIDRLELLLSVEWCLPLIVPELPCALTLVHGLELGGARWLRR